MFVIIHPLFPSNLSRYRQIRGVLLNTVIKKSIKRLGRKKKKTTWISSF